jgi:CheY-like chemotaxis protein
VKGEGRGAGLVLVVDDDDLIREVVTATLRDEGYDVASVPDGHAALQTAEASPPALILLDLAMPGLDGRGFATAYRALPGPHAPLVVFTAGASSAGPRAEDAALLAELGAAGALSKPFDLDDLVALVARFVPRPAPPREPGSPG